MSAEVTTLYDLSQQYLDWVEGNRKKGTYDNIRLHLKSFIDSVGKRLRVGQLKKHHVTKWTAQHDH